MSKLLVRPPAWFRFRSRQQEEVVGHLNDDQAAREDYQRREFERAREAALPMMSEVVRDMDSRSEYSVTGSTRVWSAEAWTRVRRNRFKRKHPIKYAIFTIFPFLKYESKYS